MSNWGSYGLDAYISTRHTTITPSIDPSKAHLRTDYTVCILGATGVIGSGIATAYTLAGASTLILASRRLPSLEETKSECLKLNPQLKVEVVKLDITSLSDFEALVSVINEKCKASLDAVVVNSGYSGPVVLDVLQDDLAMVKHVTETNYLGTYYAAHHLIPLLLSPATAASAPERSTEVQGPSSQDGARHKEKKMFIAVGSNASFIVRGPIANAQYCISKLAQLKLVEHIHEQHHSSGLVALAVHPGAIMSDTAQETAPREFLRYLTDDPALCGAFCVWLSREDDGVEKAWLGGRHCVAKWDVGELVSKKEDIVGRDLFKARVSL